ncbi:MAG: hypothetical protein CBARDMAM_4825 [uncultured Caballeronia sp.]|nr:MAG: hypothetical protein CBARDMAM_4825 [uncultured Caballeronia sp.]
MTKPEKAHIVGAYLFELSKVERKFIRKRQLGILANMTVNCVHGLPRISACQHRKLQLAQRNWASRRWRSHRR